MKIELGDFITLWKGTSQVAGQCMGFRVNQSGDVIELWVDGFYTAFEIGTEEYKWRVQSREEEADA